MSKYRKGRINDAVAQELAIALRDVRDPGIADNFVSVTRAEVAPDLKNAKVYVSVMGDEKEALAALKRANGLLRRHLAVHLNLRITPELTYCADHSIEHGARIASLLRTLSEEETGGKNQEASDEHPSES